MRIAPVAGSQTGSQTSYARCLTETTTRRRGHGEDAIYIDPAKNRYVGAVSLGSEADHGRWERLTSMRTTG
jgi:hypothetical protein